MALTVNIIATVIDNKSTKLIDAERWFSIVKNVLKTGGYKKGDVVIIYYDNKRKITAMISCPNCGELKPLRNHNVIIDEYHKNISVEPSLVNDCCGWHGFLTDNEFKSVL